MIVKILKVIFEKVVGIERIPEAKRKAYWREVGNFAVKLAGEMAEGAARGAVEGRN